MRAAVIQRLGSPPAPGEVPAPEAGPGDALVRVLAAAINPIDIAVGAGRFYRGEPEVPYVPCREGVGRVLEAAGLPAGALVRFEVEAGYDGRQGALAERAVAAESELIALPDDAPVGLAAALGIAGMAAWLGLESRGGLRPGECVLVLGASGAVGMVGVQAARIMGAGRVVAAARSAEALERARGLGADAVVLLDDADPPALAERFKEAAGDEIDLVLDPLWGPPALGAFLALRAGGRLVNCGASAALDLTLPSAPLRGRNRAVIGHSNLTTPHDVKADAYVRMLREAMAGNLVLPVEEVPLDDAADAWTRQSASPHAKLVVRIAAD